MKVLVDTNIIGRLCQPTHSLHQTAVAATERLLREGHDLRLVPQVLYEFWAVAARPVPENGFGFSVEVTQAELIRLKTIFPPLLDERGIFAIWEALVLKSAVRGKSTHDARLVAAMQRHGVADLLTFNVADFKRYADINVLDPAVVGVL